MLFDAPRAKADVSATTPNGALTSLNTERIWDTYLISVVPFFTAKEKAPSTVSVGGHELVIACAGHDAISDT